jgi:hypothetical protein
VVRLFVSGPPSAVLDRFEAALGRVGLFVFVRGPWSVAATPKNSQNGERNVGEGRPAVIGVRSPGPGTVPTGGAQLAVIPIQADPSTLRAWLTWVPGAGSPNDPVDVAVEAFSHGEREASRTCQRQVETLEREASYAVQWGTQATNIRAALLSSGVAAEAVEARLDSMRARWAGSLRRAASVEEDDPPAV